MSIKLNKPVSDFKLGCAIAITALIIFASVLNAGINVKAAVQAGCDTAAINALVEAYEKVFNTSNPSALAEFFTDDADMIMGNQPVTQGRQAIQSWWQNYFSHREEGLLSSFIISSVKFITTDVVLVNVDYTSNGRNAAGRQMPVRKARGTWIVVRKENRWLISAVRGMPTEEDRIIRGGGQ